MCTNHVASTSVSKQSQILKNVKIDIDPQMNWCKEEGFHDDIIRCTVKNNWILSFQMLRKSYFHKHLRHVHSFTLKISFALSNFRRRHHVIIIATFILHTRQVQQWQFITFQVKNHLSVILVCGLFIHVQEDSRTSLPNGKNGQFLRDIMFYSL